ncbi:hypothetical protein KC19_3G157600 [Ceratodon purpureus]|uniref:NAC domain-containing protein n=1 Tax=Ceratodon purpureus TaxID=3225 RepID=A0A8T0IIT1_CERPU|nr:hypothetical protein KC19_3G157600 [Ceratodon purpureus]
MAQRLPPGFRFHPTDVELVAYYLKERINGRPIEMNPIAEVDLYKVEPWDLPAMSALQSNDQEWYFYSARDRKYPNGSRTNRATEIGYWKSTGKDRCVKSTRSTGMKKTLVYYKGRAPRGERTDWVMHEYRMEDKVYENLTGRQEPYVLARVFKKSGAGPKNGEQYGAPFVEEPFSPPVSVEEEEVPLEPEVEQAEPEGAEVKVEVAVKEEPVAEEVTGGENGGTSFYADSILEEFLREESAHTGRVDDWAEFPEEVESFRSDGVTMQEVLDHIEEPAVDESWKEAIIDNDLMFEGGFINSVDLDAEEDVDFMGDTFDCGISMSGAVGTDDYLEINDLTPELEGFDASGSAIQLRPPRDNAVAMQFDSQGDTARRMLLMRPQASISLVGDFANTVPALNHPLRMLQPSASSRDLSAFADLASSSFDLLSSSSSSDLQIPSSSFDHQTQSEEWSNSAEPLGLGRERAGVVPDSDFWSNYEGMPPSSSSEDQGGNFQLQPELNFSSGASPGYSWPDFDPPPASPQVAEKPTEKGKFLGINRLLPILPASAAELPNFSSTYVTASETHVTALTITCSCSENGAKTVQAALMNYTGGKLHQEVMSGTWKPCTEDCKQDSCVQCSARRQQPQRKVAKGSRSGFVFVFLLGAVSALIWFLLLRGTWRVAQTMFNAIM